MDKSTFIKVDKFDTVMAAIAAVKKKLLEAKNTLNKINNLKEEEDAAAQKWAADLDSVKDKIEAIESELTKEEY